jgi:hypothetical protein
MRDCILWGGEIVLYTRNPTLLDTGLPAIASALRPVKLRCSPIRGPSVDERGIERSPCGPSIVRSFE